MGDSELITVVFYHYRDSEYIRDYRPALMYNVYMRMYNVTSYCLHVPCHVHVFCISTMYTINCVY